MTAEEFNRLHPVGTPVVAFPCMRGCPDHPGLVTVTRTPAWTLGDHTPVVTVEGYAGGIALTHVDVTGGAE
jgi:hypothetical protein